MEVLVFQLADQRYGLCLDAVREVHAAVHVTALPAAPAVIEGVIDVRGQLAAVFDLRRRFRLAPCPPCLSERLVLATAGPRLVAFRCDQVSGLVSVDADALEDPQTVVPGAEQVSGVARLEDGLLLIHDLKTFLSDAEAEELDRVVQGFEAGRETP